MNERISLSPRPTFLEPVGAGLAAPRTFRDFSEFQDGSISRTHLDASISTRLSVATAQAEEFRSPPTATTLHKAAPLSTWLSKRGIASPQPPRPLSSRDKQDPFSVPTSIKQVKMSTFNVEASVARESFKVERSSNHLDELPYWPASIISARSQVARSGPTPRLHSIRRGFFQSTTCSMPTHENSHQLTLQHNREQKGTEHWYSSLHREPSTFLERQSDLPPKTQLPLPPLSLPLLGPERERKWDQTAGFHNPEPLPAPAPLPNEERQHRTTYNSWRPQPANLGSERPHEEQPSPASTNAATDCLMHDDDSDFFVAMQHAAEALRAPINHPHRRGTDPAGVVVSTATATASAAAGVGGGVGVGSSRLKRGAADDLALLAVQALRRAEEAVRRIGGHVTEAAAAASWKGLTRADCWRGHDSDNGGRRRPGVPALCATGLDGRTQPAANRGDRGRTGWAAGRSVSLTGDACESSEGETEALLPRTEASERRLADGRHYMSDMLWDALLIGEGDEDPESDPPSGAGGGMSRRSSVAEALADDDLRRLAAGVPMRRRASSPDGRSSPDSRRDSPDSRRRSSPDGRQPPSEEDRRQSSHDVNRQSLPRRRVSFVTDALVDCQRLKNPLVRC